MGLGGDEEVGEEETCRSLSDVYRPKYETQHTLTDSMSPVCREKRDGSLFCGRHRRIRCRDIARARQKLLPPFDHQGGDRKADVANLCAWRRSTEVAAFVRARVLRERERMRERNRN